MRHGDDGLVGKRSQVLEHALLRLGVERAGGLIEQEHRPVGEQGACDGEALYLSLRQARATLAQPRVETLGQCRHKVSTRRMQRVPHALVACRALLAAEHDRIANRAAHQVISLGYVGKEAAPLRRQRFAGAVLQHDAALSCFARAEGHHRLERRRFAAAAGPRERHELAACDGHVGAAD